MSLITRNRVIGDNFPTFRDIRHALKFETRQAHDQAEALWAAGEDGTAFPMQHFLKAMLGLHLTLGLPAALILDAGHYAEVERDRIDALSQDLVETSGADFPQNRTEDLCPDAAWGVLYALNGSAMGAQVLLRTISDTERKSKAYLNLMKHYATSGDLARFYRALNRQELDQATAANGAKTVFAAMKCMSVQNRN